MIHLEIIVHLWAKQLPQYAAFARYQLSSLFAHPPQKTQVTWTVCYCPDDSRAVDVLEAFLLRTDKPDTIRFQAFALSAPQLCRRAIGRNRCARRTEADVVYFGGIDYFWGPGCLDTLAAEAASRPDKLVWPREIQIHKTHELGDAAVEGAQRIPLTNFLVIWPTEFKPEPVKVAIGCLQIVPGDVARERGYLADNLRYQRPVDPPVWKRTFEDPKFRRWLGLPKEAISVPNLYRLRHTQAGRFVDAKGEPTS